MPYVLADYAVRESQGRRYPTEPDPYRSDFQRDIGRILYSKAFRRLAFKTQVFSPYEGDHYRNRLTHTLETAQIARVTASQLHLNSELAEAIALAHDLGHPPFGHQGEDILDGLMENYGGFDHNFQNLRIVIFNEIKSDRFPGLNLTFETLVGLAKGAAARTYLRELYRFDDLSRFDSAEAAVAHLADDLAYTATDFDDYARYHDLSIADLHALPLTLVKRCLPTQVEDPRIAISVCVRNLVSTLVADAITHTKEKVEQAGGPQASRNAVIHAIGLSDEMRPLYGELAAFLRKNMYLDASLKQETLRGAELLQGLFKMEAERRKLDPNDREGYLDLCDYLSGMTDHFALSEEALHKMDKP